MSSFESRSNDFLPMQQWTLLSLCLKYSASWLYNNDSNTVMAPTQLNSGYDLRKKSTVPWILIFPVCPFFWVKTDMPPFHWEWSVSCDFILCYPQSKLPNSISGCNSKAHKHKTSYSYKKCKDRRESLSGALSPSIFTLNNSHHFVFFSLPELVGKIPLFSILLNLYRQSQRIFPFSNTGLQIAEVH